VAAILHSPVPVAANATPVVATAHAVPVGHHDVLAKVHAEAGA